jgi:cytochrome P450
LPALGWYVRFIRDSVGCLCEVYRRAELNIGHGVIPFGRRSQKSVFAFGPEYNRLILGDTATYRTTPQTAGGPANSALRRIRHGLTAMNGDEHRQQRQLVMPLFVKNAVDGYRDAAVAITDSIIQSWPLGKPIDMWREMRRLTLQTSSHVLFGREEPAVAEQLGGMIQELFERNFTPACWLLPFNLPGTPFRGLLRHAEKIERVLLQRIDHRRANPTASPDILDMLIRNHAEGKMSDTALLGQATILFAASYETQANSMTWTLFLLAQHPQVAADLFDELNRELAGAPPTVAQLDRLPLLEAVVKESMRILPTVPYTIRAVTQPTELGGVPLAIEDRVICSHYVTHHMPEIYTDPNRFNPARWFTIRPTPYEYLPFSAGQRVCIGRYMAMMLMKVSLAMICQRVGMRMLPGARIDRSVKVTMGPNRGLPMLLGPVGDAREASRVLGNIHEMVDLTNIKMSRRAPSHRSPSGQVAHETPSSKVETSQ